MQNALKKQIEERNRENLKEKRLRHVYAVAKLAREMALHYGEDPEKAELAALCHDMFRSAETEVLNDYIKKGGFPAYCLNNSNLAHSKAAVYEMEHKYGITDPDLLNAVSFHTTGRAGMSVLEKIIYLEEWADKAHGVKYISLRYFNVAGAHESGEIGEDHNPETHLIPLILQVPLGKREFISIFGDDYETHDGTCIRDYIHVTDLADAHILAVHKLREGSESNIYNLGSGNGFTVKEMIETARKVTGHEIPAKVCERRAGDPAKLVASSEKARRELGWVPKHENVEDMISSAWNWHQKHPNGFEK